MPFVEAFRQFQFRVGKENFVQLHVSLVPEAGGEQKRLAGRGLSSPPAVSLCNPPRRPPTLLLLLPMSANQRSTLCASCAGWA